MAVTLHPGPHPVARDTAQTLDAPRPAAAAHPVPAADEPIERSFFRSVAIAWLVGIPVIGAIVFAIVLAVTDAGAGGAAAVGLFAGFWVAPLAGVVGIGAWAGKHHGPHG